MSPKPAKSHEPRRNLAVITASTAGIGLSIAEKLASQNYHVILSSRTKSSVQSAIAHLNETYGLGTASGLPCHVGNPAHRAALRAHVANTPGVLRALVLNAAASTAFGPLLETDVIAWEKMLSVNVTANLELVKLFSSMLQRDSSIVFVTSLAAYTPIPNLGAYSISKTALLALNKVLAVEMASRGVRVNAVAPGLIRTNFSERLWRGTDGEDDKDGLHNFFHVPLARLGLPGDVAGVVAFLVSKDAAYVTGETIVAAGGAMSRL